MIHDHLTLRQLNFERLFGLLFEVHEGAKSREEALTGNPTRTADAKP
jgi:hypothetical protein